jgi:small subunit ribosomal protein S21
MRSARFAGRRSSMSRIVNVRYTVKFGEPFEKALKRFRRLCERAQIRSELRRKRFYEKPSDEKRRELRRNERRRRRAELKRLLKKSAREIRAKKSAAALQMLRPSRRAQVEQNERPPIETARPSRNIVAESVMKQASHLPPSFSPERGESAA